MTVEQDVLVGRFMRFITPPQSAAAIKVFIEKETLKKLENDGYFQIIENNDGAAVGYIDTRTDPRHGTFQYCVSVVPEHKRNGYAAEAITMVVGYQFNYLRYQKVTAGVHSDNQPSIDLAKRLGFQLEGTLRSMIYRDGGYVDCHYIGLTSDAFNT